MTMSTCSSARFRVMTIVVFFSLIWYIVFIRAITPRSWRGLRHNVTDSSDSLAFANDPVPRRNFGALTRYPAHNINDPSKHAFATLYCSRNSDTRDPYFGAAQSLVWRLLWSSYRSRYPFVVYVCPFIPEANRRILRGQGALVQEIELLDDIIPDVAIKTQRWIDVLSKLHLWREIQWNRIVFLDLDAFPVTNLDDIFQLVKERSCDRALLPPEDQTAIAGENDESGMCSYVYAGVLHYPPNNVNAGFLVLKPNLNMHARLIRTARRLEEYDFTEMEQGVLKSPNAFGSNGPFPVSLLPPVWNALPEYYSQYLAENRWITDGPLRVVHAKMWNRVWGSWNNFTHLNDRWDLEWMEMCRFFDSDSFAEARRTGVYKPLP